VHELELLLVYSKENELELEWLVQLKEYMMEPEMAYKLELE
jgi:hypothetical protein